MLSTLAIDPAFREVAAWNVFDANVRLGHSGVYGELALETDDLLKEMDRFGIRRALVSHFAGDEYDAEEGNNLLAREVTPGFSPARAALKGGATSPETKPLPGQIPERLVPVWAALPERSFIEKLAPRGPVVVRLSYGVQKHNFSWAPWCSGELYEFLQAHSVLTIIAREDLAWDSLAQLLTSFPRLKVLLLETGYRAERYLFPLFKQHPNLYIDTSTYVAHRQLESHVEKLGPDHLLFGSRLPLYEAGAALAVLATARIPDETRLLIAGGNLRRVLQLPMVD
jgi:hypothetical protein